MSFKERLQNTFLLITKYLLLLMGTPSKSVKADVPYKPKISFIEVLCAAELQDVKTDFLIDYTMTALSNLEYLGGIGAQPTKNFVIN